MSGAMLKEAVEGLKLVTKDIIQHENLQKVEDIINTSAIVAAVAGLGLGWVPGAGGFLVTAALTTTVWTMYVKISKELGIKWSDALLKTIASAMVSTLCANAGTVLLGFIGTSILSLIPVFGNIAGSALDCMLNYIVVFSAGVLFVKFLSKFLRKDVTNMNDEELKEAVKATVEETDINSVFEEAKKSYNSAKESGEIDKAKTTCPACGSSKRKEDKFCPNCGERLIFE